MKIGLVGLPKSGKTSLFNLLTGATVATSSFGTARGEMHAGVARVPDARVERLTAMFKPKKTTYASFEVVDLAGIAKGERQGLEAKEFRNADALLHVVRAFPDPAGTAADPGGDIDDLETELILADLEVVERRLERLEAQIKKKRTDADVYEQTVLVKVKPLLESERPIRAMGLGDDEARALRGFTFLSQKPILHCLNLSEKEIARGTTLVESFGLQAVAARPATRLGWVSAVIEAEVAQLAGPEQAAFLAACWRTATRSSVSSRSSRSVKTRCARGPSRAPPAPRTRPGPSTPTSRGASSAPRWWATTTSWPPTDPWPPRGSTDGSGSRARTTWCRTARSATSASTWASSRLAR